MRKGHITLEEREIIEISLFEGATQKKVAERLKRCPSVISREIKRGSVYVDWFSSPRGQKKVYIAAKADIKYRKRIYKKGENYPFKSQEIRKYVEGGLNRGWSPDTISGRMIEQYPEDSSMRISHEKIYQDCFSKYGKKKGLNKLLLRGKNTRQARIYRTSGRGKIPDRVDISQRPKEIDQRTEFGHWEADTVWSVCHKAAFLVLVERKTRKSLVAFVERKTAQNITKATQDLMRDIKKHVKSITYDNGSEFSDHSTVAKTLKCKTYFCQPYHSWERGTCENTNGRLRRKYPKKSDFSKVSDKELQESVGILINNHPRKCLNYRTPNECFADEVEKIAFSR